MAEHYDFESDYHGMSGDLGRTNTSWRKRIDSAPAMPPEPSRLQREYTQPLAPLDFLGLAVQGLKFTLQPTDLSHTPHLLGGYQRSKRLLALDWRLLPGAPQEPPTPEMPLHLLARWSQLVDTLPLVRFLIGWCIATQIRGNEDYPIHIGFVPVAHTERYSAILLPRYLRAWPKLLHLFAPRARLLQQCAALGYPLDLSISAVGTAWKDALRPYALNVEDAAAFLIATLAELNLCPPVLIEASLANIQKAPDWRLFARRLVLELPQLALKQQHAVAALYGNGALPLTTRLGAASAQRAERLVQLIL